MPRIVPVVVLALLIAGPAADTQAAVLLSFGGYTWDQANVPTKGLQLGVDDETIRSGATFGPAQPSTNLTRTNDINGFIESQSGANTALGYLSRITKRRDTDPTPTSPLESTGRKAINLPLDKNLDLMTGFGDGNIGNALIRRGVQAGWSTGTGGFTRPVMPNRPGTDFVIWESGNANQPDAMMVRVRQAASRQFTDWYYVTPTSSPVTGSVLFGFAYDLTNFGLGPNVQVDLIEMANMVSTDRIAATGTNTANGWVAQGKVLPQAGGSFSASNPGPDPGNIVPAYGSPFGGATYDPDPLYVSVLGNLHEFVPEPTSFISWALIGLVAFGRRRHRRID